LINPTGDCDDAVGAIKAIEGSTANVFPQLVNHLMALELKSPRNTTWNTKSRATASATSANLTYLLLHFRACRQHRSRGRLKIFQMGAEPCHGYVVDGQIADALNHNPVAPK